MTTQSINLNVIPGGVLPRINVSQYDKGLEQIVATLYEGSSAFTMPSSATVYVQGTKKDGTGFQYSCSHSNNVVTIDLTDQMTVFAGEVVTELVIFDSSNNRIATCNFIINVEQTALSDDTQISETDLPIIQTLPQTVLACEGYAETAHQWATYGSDSETPSSTNNSKYWAEQSQIYAQGALHWKGSIAFASIPTSNLTVGDLYNITDDFTTDSRFIEGSGKKCAAGTNIVWSDSSKWDILTSATYASQVKYSNTDSGLSATNVQSAIDEEKELIDGINYANGILGAKNLIPYPFYHTTRTINGITFTVNDDDGTITANGTATANAAFYMHAYPQGTMGLKTNVAYRLNGVTGGSTSTYQIFIASFSGTTQKEIFFVADNNTQVIFSQPFDGISVYCRVVSGATVSNIIFKPMIRLASDTDDTYQPYAKTNKELTDELDTINETIGTDDISGIGTSVTNAISSLNVGLNNKVNTSTTIAIAHGGTGSTTAAGARNNLDVPAKGDLNRYALLTGALFSGDVNVKGYVSVTDGTNYRGIKLGVWNGVMALNVTAPIQSNYGPLELCSVNGANSVSLRGASIECRNYENTAGSTCWAGYYSTYSSRKYKENIKELADSEAKKILDVDIVSFDYKKDSGVAEEQNRFNKTGVIAEDIVDVCPEVVTYRENEIEGVDYSKLIPRLIKLVQLQERRITELETQLNTQT